MQSQPSSPTPSAFTPPSADAPQAVVSAPIDVVPTRAGYDLWAEIYDGEDNALIALEERHIYDLLGDVRGLAVADIGCGTGRHALRLAAAGAQVAALDFSAAMLARARTKPGAADVRFLQHDLTRPFPLEDGAFDRVICGLVLEHIPDLLSLFREMRRICRTDGGIAVSAMHPAMLLRGISARFTDPATGRETRPTSYPHTLSDFITAALRAGLGIDRLSEHAVDETLATHSPRARKYLGWPMLFLMRLRPEA